MSLTSPPCPDPEFFPPSWGFLSCLRGIFGFSKPKEPVKEPEKEPVKEPEPVAKRKPRTYQKPKVCDLGADYYTTREVARALHVSVSTLCAYRRKGIGPKYSVVGYRTYRYPKEEVMRYVREMTRTSTSATQNYDLKPETLTLNGKDKQ